MKIGISFGAFPCETEECASLMEKYGFETTFCGSLSPRLAQITEACDRHGIVMESYHAPFSHINDIWLDVPEGGVMLRELTDSIDNCVRYGVPTLVVHLSSGDTPPRMSDIGFARFDKLMEYAKKNGVTIAYENQRKLANLAYVFEQYEDAGFCWDTGHEACFAYGRQYMPLFGDRLAAIHVHDNHCIHNGDDHMIPFDALIDFDRVTTQIAAANYEKSLMLEVMAANHKQYLEIGADAYYKRASEAAKRLACEIERKKLLNNVKKFQKAIYKTAKAWYNIIVYC